MDFYSLSGMLPLWLRVTLSYSGAAAILISTGYLLSKLCKSMLVLSTTINRINELIPVLFKMADQFENNGGSSLRDAIDRINKTLSEQSEIIKQNQESTMKAFKLACEASELAKFVASEIPSKVEVCNKEPIPVRSETE
jgi:hypothetical protein